MLTESGPSFSARSRQESTRMNDPDLPMPKCRGSARNMIGLTPGTPIFWGKSCHRYVDKLMIIDIFVI